MTKKKTARPYSAEVRRQAIVEYAICGSQAEVARNMDINRKTVGEWMRSDEAHELITRVRSENTTRHISQYDALTEKALNIAKAGLYGLDPTTLKAGDIRSLVVTGAVGTDKSRLLQGLPTSNASRPGSDQALSDQLRQLSRSLREKDARVVKTIKSPNERAD